MLKKIFNPKRKHQEQGKPKITLDPASQTILSRHFSPLPSRAKSPSDVLDIVGYPLIATAIATKTTTTTATATVASAPAPTRTKSVTFKNIYKPAFSQSSPELSTPLEKPYQLTIRNNISPPPPPEELDNKQVLLLEASREEKTLVEKELLDSKNLEVYRLHQKLLQLEQEREMMHQKFQDFLEREEQMRSIIEENQYRLNQLKYYGGGGASSTTRHNSYRTNSTMYSDHLVEEYPYRKSNNSDLYYHYYPRRRNSSSGSSSRHRYYYYPEHYYYYHHHT